MMPRIIVLTCNSSFGLAKFRMALMRSFKAEGYRVVAVAPRDEYTEQIEAAGIEFYDWSLSARNTKILNEARSIYQLIGIYKKIRPYLCFHYTVKAVLYGAIASRWMGIQYVSVITGLGYIFLNKSAISFCAFFLYRFFLKHSFRVLFLNNEDLKEFTRLNLIHEKKARVIPGEGVDTVYFKPDKITKSTEINFMVISRLLGDKGINEFVAAVVILRERGYIFKAHILGARGANNPTGIPDNVVDDWVQRGIINYLGTVHDVRPYLKISDCVVLPSYREGIPLALLEAAAMTLPVIATDVPGCRDVVFNKVNGFLCEARNSDSLANAMEKFLKLSQAERDEMGFQGRAFVEQNFSQQIVIKVYAELLQDFFQYRSV